jgi:NAD(P)-dependent dehydrogenase (short-subunit alcohol dehydrogenase family)
MSDVITNDASSWLFFQKAFNVALWFSFETTQPMKQLIITGCSRGIGLALASEALASSRYSVVGTSTTGDCSLHGASFACRALRLDQEASIRAFAASIEESGVQVDGLINNAAILLEDWSNPAIDLGQLRQTFEVNVFGTIALTEALMPCLKPGAHIINLSSGWGAFSAPSFDAAVPHYKMSKAALNMYTKLLAARLAPLAITVSAVDPGWVQTDMGTRHAPKSPHEAAREILGLLERELPSGGFWQEGAPRGW